MSRTLDTQTLQTIAMFEQLTGAQVRDCVIQDDQVVFIVEIGDMAKAIGKGGQHVRNIEFKLKKRIKIVEYAEEVQKFILNVIAPLEIAGLRQEGGIVFLDAKDLKTRGLLIGRGASNLRFFESLVKRYFPIDELKVA